LKRVSSRFRVINSVVSRWLSEARDLFEMDGFEKESSVRAAPRTWD